MKKEYQAYMDAVEVSPALHRRLMGLSAPRRANRWQRYGSLAAALAVLIGAAAFGLSRLGADRMPNSGKEGTVGGYTVQEEGEEIYVELPRIAYGENTADKMMDIEYRAPEGSICRKITAEDVATLAGGKAALETQLNWGDFTWWGGQGIFLEDGCLWQMTLWGEGEDLALSLEVLAGDEVPPTCLIMPTDTVTDVMGVPVKAMHRWMELFRQKESVIVYNPELIRKVSPEEYEMFQTQEISRLMEERRERYEAAADIVITMCFTKKAFTWDTGTTKPAVTRKDSIRLIREVSNAEPKPPSGTAGMTHTSFIPSVTDCRTLRSVRN